jgi:hypothetical protein
MSACLSLESSCAREMTSRTVARSGEAAFAPLDDDRASRDVDGSDNESEVKESRSACRWMLLSRACDATISRAVARFRPGFWNSFVDGEFGSAEGVLGAEDAFQELFSEELNATVQECDMTLSMITKCISCGWGGLTRVRFPGPRMRRDNLVRMVIRFWLGHHPS